MTIILPENENQAVVEAVRDLYPQDTITVSGIDTKVLGVGDDSIEQDAVIHNIDDIRRTNES